MLRFLYLKQDFDESEIISHLNENENSPRRFAMVELKKLWKIKTPTIPFRETSAKENTNRNRLLYKTWNHKYDRIRCLHSTALQSTWKKGNESFLSPNHYTPKSKAAVLSCVSYSHTVRCADETQRRYDLE